MSVAAQEVLMHVLPLNTVASMRLVLCAQREKVCLREDPVIHTLRTLDVPPGAC